MNGWARLGIGLATSLLAHWVMTLVLDSLPPREPVPPAPPERITMTVYEKVIVPPPVVEVAPVALVEPIVPLAEVAAVNEPPMDEPPPAPPPAKVVARERVLDMVVRQDKLIGSLDALMAKHDGGGASPFDALLAKEDWGGFEGGLTPRGEAGGGAGPPDGGLAGVGRLSARGTGGGSATRGGDADLGRRDAPVPAHEVSKMPVVRGVCAGQYTQAARDAGIEGTVVLDLVVTADGRTRNVKVVKGLDRGLDRAAVRALSRCRFSPGERDGEAVAVRLRAFTMHFRLDE